jgi:hypothetical protein
MLWAKQCKKIILERNENVMRKEAIFSYEAEKSCKA